MNSVFLLVIFLQFDMREEGGVGGNHGLQADPPHPPDLLPASHGHFSSSPCMRKPLSNVWMDSCDMSTISFSLMVANLCGIKKKFNITN